MEAVQDSFFPEKDALVVRVHPLSGVGRDLDYRVPDALAGKVAVGSLLRVPILNRHELAIVMERGVAPEIALSKLRFVAASEQPFPVLTEDLVKLARWMTGYYAASLDAVLETMIPGSVR